MKNLYNKVSIFSVLALVAIECQNLQATSNTSSETVSPQKPVKSLTSESFDFLEDTLKGIKKCSYVSQITLKNIRNIAFEDLKQFESTILSNDDMLDSWISLVLKIFSENSSFEDILKIAKERDENELATPAALNNLGVMYQNGQGINKDLIKAVELYQKAADQENMISQYNLGYMYQNGQGVDKDFIKAVELYQKAADQGHVISQYNLGVMYQNGQGVDKDLTKAFELHEKAANQRYANAQCSLGVMYQNGQGVDKDLIIAK